MRGSQDQIAIEIRPTASAGESDRSGEPNPKPEELSWQRLERQDWHLWILAIVLIFLFGISLLVFMYPAAFWLGQELAIRNPERVFFGFSVLLFLVLVYLFNRQATVRQLKRRLFEAQSAIVAAERDAQSQAFRALPGTDQFHDVLAMEYRRASTTGSALAGILFTLRDASPEIMAHFATILRNMLRRGEHMYSIGTNGLALILPNLKLCDSASFTAQAELLSGLPTEGLEATVAAFPEEIGSLAEMELRLSKRDKWFPKQARDLAIPL